MDPQHFLEVERGSLSAPIRVAFVGRLVPCKGVDMLIESAAPFVLNRQIRLQIIGDGPEAPHLKHLVCDLNIENGVDFLGWVPHEELHTRLVDADVFGFPSIREFGGGAVLEAMAMGLPAIVVDYGGPGETVTDECGWKVPLGKREFVIAHLREILMSLINNPAVISIKGRAARDRVCRLYTWNEKARQIFEVYQWVVGVRNQRPSFEFQDA